MDPQSQPGEQVDPTANSVSQIEAIRKLIEGVKLSAANQRWPLNIEDRSIRSQLRDEILSPLGRKEIDLETAEGRWEKLYDKNKFIAALHPVDPADLTDTGQASPTGEAASTADSAFEDDGPELHREEMPAPDPPPLTPVKAQWLNIDPPSDDPDFVPNEASAVDSANDWKVIAASVRGKSHAHKGTFRDDAFGFAECGAWTIVVVSDGAGSSRLSRIASQIACDAAIVSLKSTLANYKLSAPPGDTENLNSDLTRLRSFLVDAARTAQEAVLREVGRREIEVRDMYATLLVMLHTKWGEHEIVAALQVGDGAIGVLHQADADDWACTVLGDADHGDYSSETRFLTTPGIEREFTSRVKFTLKRQIGCIGVMSDGVSDDFFPEDQRLVQLFCGAPIEVEGFVSGDGEPVAGVMQGLLKDSAPDDDLGTGLIKWLQYEKRGSFDDRTLVLLHRSLA
ncbi:protein phosphatase 2C domain-containing protein [Blastopirellula sp. JC732]|uniref:Protein phosphatase 2C domain-containing protein n=1 Tax=Blastopirellula sediminis TaxID=2894196 RepID=A0A9X1MKP4_9BACT|nr:PP2C family serine/threonine-protein phosphatase [Blastopirellula sediminis]MCC9608612.1 protein phosphatase 2C domain-containing protein [Blastopirellula sediminis]MCC9628611.1 protein phosphatase 2C domain-containing protein [Blastopirellula sediminis]